jgi:hypothetical protein
MKESYVGPPSSNFKGDFNSTLLGRMFAVEGTAIDIVAILSVLACVALTATLEVNLKSSDLGGRYASDFGFGIAAGPLLGLIIGSVMKLMGDKSMSIVRCMLWCSVAVLLFIVFAAMGAGI